MLRYEPAADAAQIFIEGDLTIYAAAELWQELRGVLTEASNKPLSLDLSGVTELDSAGLQLLLVAAKHCRERDVALSLGNRSAAVEQVLQLANVASAFESPQAAQESCQ